MTASSHDPFRMKNLKSIDLIRMQNSPRTERTYKTVLGQKGSVFRYYIIGFGIESVIRSMLQIIFVFWYSCRY